MLSGPEYQAVLNALSVISLSREDRCGADKPGVKLLVDAPGGSRTYKDDFYSCRRFRDTDAAIGDGADFVSNIDTLDYLLRGLASISELPKELTSLSVSDYALDSGEPAPGSNCGYGPSVLCELDFATRQLTWRKCAQAPGSNIVIGMGGLIDVLNGLAH